MPHRDSFSGYHPAVNFLYFAMVLLCTMFLMHPISLGISLLCAVAYCVNLGGKKALKNCLCFTLPVMLLAAVLNPLFNHEGVTILLYLPTGNPLTLESILYGAAAAVMLGAVILWFSCYSSVMTSDKFVYLFGRTVPALSLVFSMTLRFVPRFKAQLKIVNQAQKCLGRDTANGSLFQRLRNTVTILSIMVTWSLENAIETADSMKGRGYGLKGRTSFSIYRFQKQDLAALLWILFCGGVLLTVLLTGGLSWRYYPTLKGADFDALALISHLIYLALCLTPLILNRKENWKWKRFRSAI